MEEFEWSTNIYSALELIDTFDTEFPLVVKVVKGYHGENAWESLSQSQVLGLHSWGFHQRVVCHDSHKRYYSIPVTYPARFSNISPSSNTKTGSLQQILHKTKLPLEVVLVQPDDVQEGMEMAIPRDNLCIIDTYQERYIKGNLLRKGSINEEIIIIPVHLDVSFVVSKPGKGRDSWRKSSIEMNDTVNKVPVNNAILHYSRAMVENVTGDFNRQVFYESLRPIHISIESPAKDDSHLTSSSGDPSSTEPLTVSNLNDLSSNIANLSLDQVIDCLKLLNLGQYEKKFRQNHIDGRFLQKLELTDCVKDIGMGGVEAKRLVMFISGWRPKE